MVLFSPTDARLSPFKNRSSLCAGYNNIIIHLYNVIWFSKLLTYTDVCIAQFYTLDVDSLFAFLCLMGAFP